MEGKAFLNTAQKLTQMRDEPALRSAVSRAYYAVYNCCIHLMISKEFQNHLLCQGDLVYALAIILQIEKYSKEPHRAQLRNGLRDYHAKINPSTHKNSP
jgi:hypothetical protein